MRIAMPAQRMTRVCHLLLIAALLTGFVWGAAPALVFRIANVSMPTTAFEPLASDHLLSGAAPSQTDAGQALPQGLSTLEWDSLQQQIRRAEYYYTRHTPSEAYTAPNRANGWHTALSATGARVTPAQLSPSHGARKGQGWEWGLTLTGYGYTGHQQTVASTVAPVVIDNRVELTWDDNLTEWYLNDERGLEQGFTLAAPPPKAMQQRELVRITDEAQLASLLLHHEVTLPITAGRLDLGP